MKIIIQVNNMNIVHFKQMGDGYFGKKYNNQIETFN